jgi:hypothetical protein
MKKEWQKEPMRKTLKQTEGSSQRMYAWRSPSFHHRSLKQAVFMQSNLCATPQKACEAEPQTFLQID